VDIGLERTVMTELPDATVGQKTIEATASAVESVAGQLAKLLERGYGYTFLTLGVLTVIGAVALRFDDPHKFVTGIVVGILGLGLALICMAFAFFVIDLRVRAHTVESLERQNEVITEALVTRSKVVQEKQSRAGEAASVGGFAP
jgi:hypothetical protein